MANALARLLSESYEPLVYHYCPLHAFEGIIERGCFWASDLRSMNDPREVKRSFETVEGYLASLSFAQGSVSSNLLEMTSGRFLAFNKFSRFFSSSFTYSHDDLYSWLNYGGRGSGVAVGIRKSVHSSFFWRDVTYSEDVFRDRLQSTWADHVTRVADGEDIEDVATGLAIALQKIAVSHKHGSWASEKEARMIFPVLIKDESGRKSFDLDVVGQEVLKEKKVKFKSNSSGLRPYIEIKLLVDSDGSAEDSLAEVMIGPNNSSEVEVIQAFLSANGHFGVSVEKSKCEFR